MRLNKVANSLQHTTSAPIDWEKPPAPATWILKSNAEKTLHLSLFPPILTPQEVRQRFYLQANQLD